VSKPKLYSTAEAAEYLGIHLETLKYHIYDQKHIEPDYTIGRDLAFLQSTLDDFKAKHQAKGLTMKEAAEYLGVNVSWIRNHVYNTGKLVPDGKSGTTHVFSMATLEAARPLIGARRGRKPKNAS
jgi:DNA-binding CsgD family transcriptional regulator